MSHPIFLSPDALGTIVTADVSRLLSHPTRAKRRGATRRVIKQLRALGLVPVSWTQVAVGQVLDQSGAEYIVLLPLNPAHGEEVTP